MSTTLVAQFLPKSCWAASLDMFTDGQLKQCSLLREDHGGDVPTNPREFCNDTWLRDNRGAYVGNTKTLRLVKDRLVLAGRSPVSNNGRTVPSFEQLQSDIGASAITLMSWGFANNLHFIVPVKTVEQQLTGSVLLQWIKILDPYPATKGRTYYLNYKQFAASGWFKGMIFQSQVNGGDASQPTEFSDADPKQLVQRYLDSLATTTSDFRQVTNVAGNHQILDYNFNVTNINVSILLANGQRFFDSILVGGSNLKMYLAGLNNKYTAYFLNSADNSYYISTLENGLRYLPVAGTNHAGVVNLAQMAAPARAVSRGAKQLKVIDHDQPDKTEQAALKYFEKLPNTALICQFFDIGQEYVFFVKDGRVRVFDPFRSFAYIFPKSHKGISHLSLKAFLAVIPSFYKILNEK